MVCFQTVVIGTHDIIWNNIIKIIEDIFVKEFLMF